MRCRGFVEEGGLVVDVRRGYEDGRLSWRIRTERRGSVVHTRIPGQLAYLAISYQKQHS